MTVGRFLWKYLKKLKMLLAITLLLFVLSMAISRISVYIGAAVVATIVENTPATINLNKFGILLAALFGTILLSTLCLYLSHRFEIRFQKYFNTRLLNELFVQIHRHSVAFFNEEMVGRILSKSSKISRGTQDLLSSFLSITMTLSHLVTTLLIISFIKPSLGLFSVFIVVIFTFITFRVRKNLVSGFGVVANLETQTEGIMSDSVTHADVVKAFANLKSERLYIFKNMNKFWKLKVKFTDIRSKTTYKNNSIFDAMTIIFYGSVFYTWYISTLNVTGIIFIISSISLISTNVKSLGYAFTSIFMEWGELKDGLGFLYQEIGIKDIAGAKALKLSAGEVVFDNIKYAYHGKDALFNQFNLIIKGGEKVGLVGRSGSGKSTLIKLLVRYYDIQEGCILIDNQDIAKVRQDSLRRNIAVIPQDTTLFNRTVMENIRYGNQKATDEEVINAAKAAYCHDFIMALPNGYDSKVGEKGVMLSGGERQRIAIARAILQNAAILILDEATSALDSESEQYIQKALQSLMKNKTVIAIAHRLSTLREMDRIVVMDKGCIIEDGNHNDLMRAKKSFYNFYKMQSEGFIKAE